MHPFRALEQFSPLVAMQQAPASGRRGFEQTPEPGLPGRRLQRWLVHALTAPPASALDCMEQLLLQGQLPVACPNLHSMHEQAVRPCQCKILTATKLGLFMACTSSATRVSPLLYEAAANAGAAAGRTSLHPL